MAKVESLNDLSRELDRVSGGRLALGLAKGTGEILYLDDAPLYGEYGQQALADLLPTLPDRDRGDGIDAVIDRLEPARIANI